MNQKKLIFIIIGLTLSLYLFFPIIAAFFKISNREGPVIYSLGYHSILYKLSYSEFHDATPRIDAYQSVFYNRPLFYGLDKRIKSKDEIDSIMQELKKSKSPFYQVYLKELKSIDTTVN